MKTGHRDLDYNADGSWIQLAFPLLSLIPEAIMPIEGLANINAKQKRRRLNGEMSSQQESIPIYIVPFIYER